MTAHTALRGRHLLAVLAAMAAIAATVVAFTLPGRSAGRTFPPLVPAPAPAGWPHLTLPNGTAVLSYPPSLRPVSGDTDAVSAAQVSPGEVFQLYLNATPRQGDEQPRSWAAFRLRLLTADDAASARELAAAREVRFRGGTGSCVIDTYVTRIGAHRYQELACLVQGRTSASVIVAAAPAATWAQASPLLLRAVAAYQVR
ncbi:MAG: hypothetical protein JO132_00205 [Streptosporangiaceae bacterium]|nr:hypothetical protein [Streptosporangiaceae bacterium]